MFGKLNEETLTLDDKKVTPIFIDDIDMADMSHEEVRSDDRDHPDVTEFSKIKVRDLDTNQTLRLHYEGETTISLDLGCMVPTETS